MRWRRTDIFIGLVAKQTTVFFFGEHNAGNYHELIFIATKRRRGFLLAQSLGLQPIPRRQLYLRPLTTTTTPIPSASLWKFPTGGGQGLGPGST